MMFTPDAFNYFQHDPSNSAVPHPSFSKWGATAAALVSARRVLEETGRDLNVSMLQLESEIRRFFLECTQADQQLQQQFENS